MTDPAATVDALLGPLCADLVALTRIPSIAFPGHPEGPVREAHAELVRMLRESGVDDVRTLDLPDTAPVIVGGVDPPDPDAPTVLLYGHYDVQPPGDTALWDTPPFEPVTIDGAIYARGVADDKANLMVHLGALRFFGGRPPVGVKILFEGQEEYGSALDDHPPNDPEAFACDAMIIADLGNIRPGTPTLTVALRGAAEVFVEVRTLVEPRHSGTFGGACPDALLTLIAALATLHDARGDVAVPGLRREEWPGRTWTDEEFRELAGVPTGVPLMGTGGLGERLWSGPAITVTGLDAPTVAQGVSAVVPHARARINLRFHPAQDPREAQAALIRHLEGLRPFGVPLRVTAGDTGAGFTAATDGPAYQAAREALRTAWGGEPVLAASGGSIPLVNGLATAVPAAEVLIFGAQDGMCNLHGPNERLLISELRAAVLAEVEFLRLYAGLHRTRNGRA